MYKKQQYLQTLRFFVEFFEKRNYKWCLGSSGALMVYDIDVKPNDLDIIVDTTEIGAIYKELGESTTVMESTEFIGNIVKKFGVNVGPVLSEVVGFDLSKVHLKILEWEGLRIPVNSLETELSFYRMRPGKEAIIKLIEEKLKK